jgi:hypothetical protein
MFSAIAVICLLFHTAVMQDCKTPGEQVSGNGGNSLTVPSFRFFFSSLQEQKTESIANFPLTRN